MIVLTLGSPIPLRRSLTVRSAHVTAIVSASRSSMRSRYRSRPPSRLRQQRIPPRRIVPHRLSVDVRLVERFRRRFRAFSPECPAQGSRTNDLSVHGRSRPIP